MSENLTWRAAIIKILEENKKPMHYRDITDEILSRKLRTKFGATPSDSVHIQISDSIKKKGDESRFVKIAPGIFALKEVNISEPEEPQYKTITSFGMFWRKKSVEWISKPRILGVQNIGANDIDFQNQIGIYLLYDGREVIYVGRSTDRPLGMRLYEHTRDRLSERWDRFSWFGLLPVLEDGNLGELPQKYDSNTIIPALEAVLIEALEPRQNRRRGDDLAAVEYIQKEDPKIEKKKLRDLIERNF